MIKSSRPFTKGQAYEMHAWDTKGTETVKPQCPIQLPAPGSHAGSPSPIKRAQAGNWLGHLCPQIFKPCIPGWWLPLHQAGCLNFSHVIYLCSHHISSAINKTTLVTFIPFLRISSLVAEKTVPSQKVLRAVLSQIIQKSFYCVSPELRINISESENPSVAHCTCLQHPIGKPLLSWGVVEEELVPQSAKAWRGWFPEESPWRDAELFEKERGGR